MNYPFLYQILNRLDVNLLKSSILIKNNLHVVWDDWFLQEIESDMLSHFVKHNFNHLEVFGEKFFISTGTSSNFHIDRFEYFHLTHRILIPLDQNFHYEWIIDYKKISFQPEIGQVLLMNNMIPHRFVSNNLEQPEKRDVIYFDLIDPAIKHHVNSFKKNYSSKNAELDKVFSLKK